ncbi:MAG: hypothetical protein IPM99_18900 [Rubrivivax sp.]|nr:hypothetical protein [Rubrivivax sp.]
MANGSIAVQVDIKGLKPTQELHAAVCNAVAMLNCCPEAARLTDVRRAHDTLRQALVDFADAYMDEPVTESERAAVAAKHQRKPRVTTAAELKQQAKSDTSCVGAFARARPGKT